MRILGSILVFGTIDCRSPILPPTGCHEAYYRSKVDQSVKVPHTKNELPFLASELVNVEVSHKVC